MYIRYMNRLVSLLAVACLTGILRAAENTTVPEIRSGEVLICEPYPYRTVKNTSRTVYQMARLGFVSVRSFQQTHHLNADGIIGPQTQQRVEAEFMREFGQPSIGATDSATLAVSIQPISTATGIMTSVAVRSEAAKPVRIVGSLASDEAHGFTFTNPVALLRTKTCLRHGDLVVCGGRSMSVALAGSKTVITGNATLPLLATGESGRLYASITYLNADLVEHVVATDIPIPSDGQK